MALMILANSCPKVSISGRDSARNLIPVHENLQGTQETQAGIAKNAKDFSRCCLPADKKYNFPLNLL